MPINQSFKSSEQVIINQASRMGWIFGDSSEENVDNSKVIDTAGNVNNNVIIQEAKDTHTTMLMGERLLFATYLLVGAELLKVLLFVYQTIQRKLKKKYSPKLPSK